MTRRIDGSMNLIEDQLGLETNSTNDSFFHQLPDQLVKNIFAQFLSVKGIGRMSLTCKKCHTISMNEELWTLIAKRLNLIIVPHLTVRQQVITQTCYLPSWAIASSSDPTRMHICLQDYFKIKYQQFSQENNQDQINYLKKNIKSVLLEFLSCLPNSTYVKYLGGVDNLHYYLKDRTGTIVDFSQYESMPENQNGELLQKIEDLKGYIISLR